MGEVTRQCQQVVVVCRRHLDDLHADRFPQRAYPGDRGTIARGDRREHATRAAEEVGIGRDRTRILGPGDRVSADETQSRTQRRRHVADDICLYAARVGDDRAGSQVWRDRLRGRREEADWRRQEYQIGTGEDVGGDVRAVEDAAGEGQV